MCVSVCPTPCIPWTGTHQGFLSMEFSRQEHWSGLAFPSPGDLPDPGVRPESPALWADSLPSEALAQFTNLPNLCYMFLHLLGSHRSSRNHLLQIVFMLQKIKLGFTVVLTCPSVQRQSVMELRKTQESSEVLFYSIYNLVSVVLILGSGEMGFPGSSAGKESACNAGDPSSIPELERSPGGGHGNPHQYSCLENPMDRGAWPATYSPWGGKSQT